MKASPSHRGARTILTGRSVRKRLVVALLALLAQIVLPHVHRWQVAAHHEPAAAQVATIAPITAAFAAADHAESRCPVCQALAASHDFLVAAAYHPVPVVGERVAGPLLDARTAHVPARAHAPRSPPLAA